MNSYSSLLLELPAECVRLLTESFDCLIDIVQEYLVIEWLTERSYFYSTC